MTPQDARHLLLIRSLMVVALLAIFSAAARGQQTAARPDRGFLPGASYAISDFENISLSSGNVNLSIPLASLPPIAGGKLKLTVSAIYNSKLWNVTRKEYQPGTFNGCASWVVDQPQLSERGSWQISGGYGIQIREAIEDFDYAVPDPLTGATCETNSYENNSLRNYHWYRVVLITPDGAEHDLRPVDNSNRYEGSRGYLYGHYRDTFQTLNTPMRYYSYDGSFIWAVLNPNSYSTQWTIYLNDGTKVVQTSDGVQRITDTNGNSIKIFTDSNGTHYQDEQTRRELKYTYDPSGNGGNGQGHILYQTVGGIWESVDINYGTTRVQGKLYRVNDWNPTGGETGTGAACWYHGVIPATDIPVVRGIVYPVTEPNVNPRQFTFAYNSDVTSTVTDYDIKWQCDATQLTSYTRTVSHGMGSLSQITTPSGATIGYSYSKDGTHNFSLLDQTNEIPRETVTQKEVTHDGVSETWTYQIYEAIACGGTVTAPDGAVTTESCNPKDPAFGQAYSTGEFAGLSVVSVQAGKVRTDRHWTSLVFSGGYTNATGSATTMGNFNPVVDAEYVSLLDGSGNRIKMSAKTFQYDYNGNVTQETDYDWFDPALVTFDSSGVPTGVPASATVLRVSSNGYYNPATSSSSGNVYAKRSLSTGLPLILNASQQTTAGPSIAQLSYDGNAYGTVPTVGNLTGKSVWDDVDSKWITSSSTYDSYGNPTSATDGLGKVTSFYYDDSTHAVPNRVTVDPQNSTGTQTATRAFDFYTGLVTSATDPNGNVSTIDYTNQLLNLVDPFGRPGITKSPAVTVNGTSQQHRVTTTYEDHLLRVTTAVDLYAEDDKLLKTRTTADMLGRTILSEQTEDGTNYSIFAHKAYDTANRITYSSGPMRSGSASTDSWTRATSDALGRMIEVATFAGASQPPATGTTSVTGFTGTVTSAYDANFTTVTDQAGKQRRSVVDGGGRLVRVDEPDANNSLGTTTSPAQPTSYDYDVFGNLLHVYQGSQTRTFAYDSLSRLRSAVNPESGTISYTYDDNGNLATRTDARSIVSTYVYDALNRATSRSYSDSTPTVTYAYDTLTNGKGRLTSVSSSVSSYSYSGYDATGKPSGGTETLGSQPYTLSYVYDLSGHVTSMTYPSGRTVANTFDSAGRTTSVTGTLGDITNTSRTYASGITYGPGGQMTQEQFGTTTAIYNKLAYNSRGQLAEMRASTVGGDTSSDRGKIINDYSDQCSGASCNGTDNNGNLKKQTIFIPSSDSFAQSYAYDSLNRLQSVNETKNGGSVNWQQQYVYDRYGNRTVDQDILHTYGSGIPKPNFTASTANNRLGVPTGLTGTMTYDSAGNLTTDTYSAAAVTRLYDAENRMTKETQAGSYDAGIYSYDGDGRRVKRLVGLTETWQVYGLGGELVAEYAANADHLLPQKEYGYRNGELLVTTTIGTGSGSAPTYTAPDPLVAGVEIKLEHLTELRTAVNQLRAHAGLAAATWTTDPAPVRYVTEVKADHILELRAALEGARSHLGLSTGGYAHSGLHTGDTIYAIDFQELRNQIASAWSSVQVNWLVSDQLGTPRMIFDESGSLSGVSRHDYLPFGEEIGANIGGRTPAQGYTLSDNVRQKFTQKERDNETGLDYFGARYYASTQGRFTSVDPYNVIAVTSTPRELRLYIRNPQIWDLYTYALNNPLRIVDPDGLDPKPVFDWSKLSDDERRIFENSAEMVGTEGNSENAEPVELRGEQLFNYMTQNSPDALAGLLNQTAQLASITFDVGGQTRTALSFVNSIAGVEPDRAYLEVDPKLKDLIANDNRFSKVPGHDDAGYPDSWKDNRPLKAQLQTSFNRSGNNVDADTDLYNIAIKTNNPLKIVVGTLGHAKEVGENHFGHHVTDPYEVRELLIKRGITPRYSVQ